MTCSAALRRAVSASVRSRRSAARGLPRIIAQFEKKYPQIQIDVLEENSIHKIEEWLTGGRIDVAFFARQPYHTFDWILLKMDPYYGILPLEHELTSYDRLTAADLRTTAVSTGVLLDGGADIDITRFFQQHGVTIRSRFNSNQDFTIARMVEAGLGVAILPELLLTSQLTGTCHVETRPIDPPLYRDLGMALRAGEGLSPRSTGSSCEGDDATSITDEKDVVLFIEDCSALRLGGYVSLRHGPAYRRAGHCRGQFRWV